jgi:hypothetical protein
VRVGSLDVSILVDVEGSFATVAEAIVGHFPGPGRFGRQGEGFSWSSLAEEGETAVE